MLRLGLPLSYIEITGASIYKCKREMKDIKMQIYISSFNSRISTRKLIIYLKKNAIMPDTQSLFFLTHARKIHTYINTHIHTKYMLTFKHFCDCHDNKNKISQHNHNSYKYCNGQR